MEIDHEIISMAILSVRLIQVEQLSVTAGRMHITVMFLSFRTPKTFVVITLKFELCGSTID